jgi:hypothetical protein
MDKEIPIFGADAVSLVWCPVWEEAKAGNRPTAQTRHKRQRLRIWDICCEQSLGLRFEMKREQALGTRLWLLSSLLFALGSNLEACPFRVPLSARR